jgi:Helitron helicase-like domain at N-terminus
MIGHPAYNELAYPLLFPYGPNSSYSRRERLSLLGREGGQRKASLSDYYRYFLQVREREFNPIHYANRLAQQFIIDARVQIEDYELNWISSPAGQEQIRAEVYQTLEDTLALPNTTLRGADIGHKVILPHTFRGGDRWMQRLYLNSMAIVAMFGKLTFFITITANPEWPEIRENIHRWQDPIDRPDIVSRVFRLKVDQIIHELRMNHVMGEYWGLVRTIEY